MLHVPYTMAFISVRLPCASINALELCCKSENGRQDLKGTVLVMFWKKLKHETLEKFCPRDWSHGCGKGVGSTGGEEGTVGSGWAVPGGNVEDAVGEPEPDGGGGGDEVKEPETELELESHRL